MKNIFLFLIFFLLTNCAQHNNYASLSYQDTVSRELNFQHTTQKDIDKSAKNIIEESKSITSNLGDVVSKIDSKDIENAGRDINGQSYGINNLNMDIKKEDEGIDGNMVYSKTPNNKKTYTCYKNYSDMEASSLNLDRPVAEIQYDHCLLSQYTHKIECTAATAIYVYRINNVPSPCDGIHEFNNISGVFNKIKNIHKSTYWKANYYTNERLMIY